MITSAPDTGYSNETLMLPAAILLAGDCHKLIDRYRGQLEQAIHSYESWGDKVLNEDRDEEEPFGMLMAQILDYDALFGYTPKDFGELKEYVEHLKHGPPWFTNNGETNRQALEALFEVLDDLDFYKDRISTPEARLPRFCKKAEMLRVIGLCQRTIWYARGVEQIKNKDGSHRAVGLNDAYRISRNIADGAAVPLDAKESSDEIPAIPECACYGWLGGLAKKSGMPLGYVYLALCGIYAGNKIIVDGDTVHPALFIALTGDVETGKTQAIRYSEKALGMGHPAVLHHAPASDRGLITELKSSTGDSKNEDIGTRVLALSELRYMLSKMEIQNSALPPMLCEVWDSDNEIGASDKKSSDTCRVTLSIVAGLKAADPQDFASVFGAETLHGLYSRFLLGADAAKWDFDAEAFDIMPEKRIPAAIRVPKEHWQELAAWRKAKSGRGRLAENAIRLAVITEAADKGSRPMTFDEEAQGIADSLEVDSIQTEAGTVVVEKQVCKLQTPASCTVDLSKEALDKALLVMEWQEQLRARFQPSQGIDDDARCTETILAYLRKNGPMKWNTLNQNLHLSQKYGASRVKRVRDGLVAVGNVSYDADTGIIRLV